MTEKSVPPQVSLTDPRALRAYAHPVRMALVGLLRREGPCTATRAAALTGESVASCSYHLRMLAKYGLVEEADPGGPGREKPWRATAEYTDWPAYSEDPAVASAAESLTLAVAENQFHRMAKAMEARHALPREWQQAEGFSDTTLYLTAEELDALGEQVTALVQRYGERVRHPELRPEGARRVVYLQAGFVAPEPEPEQAATPGQAAGAESAAGAEADSSPEPDAGPESAAGAEPDGSPGPEGGRVPEPGPGEGT